MNAQENKKETTLEGLRGRIARMEGRRPGRPTRAFAVAERLMDRAVPVGAFHEVVAESIAARGAASGFALALVRSLGRKRWLWIQVGGAGRELGRPYGPGLAAFGLDPDRLLILSAASPQEALWAAEEGLSTPALGAVLVEIEGAPTVLDATAVRRLKLRGEAHAVPGVLLRHGTAAARDNGLPVDLRWRVAPAPVPDGPRHLLDPPVFAVDLVKNRFGRTGPLTLAWEAFDACFVPLAGPSPAAAADRPSGAPAAGRARGRAG